MNERQKLEREIKTLLYVFIGGLFLSGVTAFPIHTELAVAAGWIASNQIDNDFTKWILTVYNGVREVDTKFPFIAYGTDWLAYAHLVLAILFAGIVRDPVRNIWVLEFGLIACAGIFPLAFIAGAVRHIPFYWQLLDCSFGLFGGIVLWMCYRRVLRLEHFFNAESGR